MRTKAFFFLSFSHYGYVKHFIQKNIKKGMSTIQGFNRQVKVQKLA
jgi:hypothetical protein